MIEDFLKHKELRYKAIETHFDGCRFRSRLEARWAVFFNTLGIKYEYEKEGFDLDGVRYLPDFWLPTLDCWVEIKGQPPTEEEIHKAKALSLYTKKQVFSISGSIVSPATPSLQSIRVDYPPYLIVHTTKTSNEQGWEEYIIDAAPEILTAFQVASEAHLSIERYHDMLRVRSNIQIIPGHFAYDAPRFQQKLQEQLQNLSLAELALKQYWDELENLVLSVGPQDELCFWEQRYSLAEHWVACDECSQVFLSINDCIHEDCKSEVKGISLNDSPRIVEAYTAARQARFEYGEKGEVKV